MAAYWIKDIALEEFTDNILDAFDDASSDQDEDENIVTVPTLMSSPDDTERTPICLPHNSALIHWTVHSCVISPNRRESSEKGRQTMHYKVFSCHYARSQCSTGQLSDCKQQKRGNHVHRRKSKMQMPMRDIRLKCTPEPEIDFSIYQLPLK